MIQAWTIYSLEDGSIKSCIASSEIGTVELNTPDGCAFVEGQSDPLRQAVINGVIVDKPQDELDAIEAELAYNSAFGQATSRRRELLYQSDWTQVPDAPVDQAAWAVYRQALRDITLQEGFPFDITWPNPPA